MESKLTLFFHITLGWTGLLTLALVARTRVSLIEYTSPTNSCAVVNLLPAWPTPHLGS